MESSDDDCDRIRIRELELKVRIGVADKERAKPQRLTISITLWPKARFHEMRDQLARTVNYAAVAREVKQFASGRTDNLIETLAENIASHLLQTFPLRKVRLELRKFILPDVKHVAVILTRQQSAAL